MSEAYQLDGIQVYRQHKRILDIPALQIQSDQCIALLGENGAGKSTLLDLLAFLYRPEQGSIRLEGDLVKSKLSVTQRRLIGYVSQQPFLLSGTIADNIRLALKLQGINPKQYDKLITQALGQVNLTPLANQTASTLSGGQLKRAAIARAIAHQPSVLLLDEPFSHLDQSHIKQLENIIEQLAQQPGKTIIFSTHDRLQGAALADTTINLVHGSVTKSPLINLFHGQLNNHVFDTGHLQIHTTSQQTHAKHIAIDPNEIIISSEVLDSSMRNHFRGRLIAITQEATTIRLTVDCGDRFHALISPESLHSLNLKLGEMIYLSFKSTAVSVF